MQEQKNSFPSAKLISHVLIDFYFKPQLYNLIVNTLTQSQLNNCQ